MNLIMKLKSWAVIPAVLALIVPAYFAAENETVTHSRYAVVDLGTLGGPNSSFQSSTKVVNARRKAIISADTAKPDPGNPCFNPVGTMSDCFLAHAAVWSLGKLKDLGTLPGGSFSQPLWIEDNGLIVGASDIGIPDPLTGEVQTSAVLWQNDGRMINLGTLGGNQSGGIAVNTQGQVIGAALNTIPDVYSVAGIVGAFAAATETRAFLWQNGVMHDLGTLGGPDSFAQYINESGQVAGFSYTNSTPDPNTGMPPIHPFLWQHGQMLDLGTFGGAFAVVDDLNNAGQVVGPMDLSGDQTFHPFLWDRGHLLDLGTLGGDNGEAFTISDNGLVAGRADLPGGKVHHAFLWKNGHMQDLGVPAGLTCSTALSVNSRGQVVGDSGICGVGGHGFIWEKSGAPLDLTSLIPASSKIQVAGALYITEDGTIAAIGNLPDGSSHAILLIPSGQGGDWSRDEVPVTALATETAVPDDQKNRSRPSIRERVFGRTRTPATPNDPRL